MNQINFLKIMGAGVAVAAVGYGVSVMKQTSNIEFTELNEADNKIIGSNIQIANLCDRLSIFKRSRQEVFAELLHHSCVLVVFYQKIRSKTDLMLGSIRRGATFVSNIVETIRKFRAHIKREDPKMISDFDEVASDFQKALNDISHNIQFTVETYIQSK